MPPQPFDVRAPFTRAAARRHGISMAELRTPSYRRLFYDLYVAADVAVTPILRAKAAIRVSRPGSHASHSTAAEIWRACPPRDPDTHVTVPFGTFRPRRGGATNLPRRLSSEWQRYFPSR